MFNLLPFSAQISDNIYAEKNEIINDYKEKFSLDKEFLRAEMGVESIFNLGELLKNYKEISGKKRVATSWIASFEERDREKKAYENFKIGALGVGILIGGNLLAHYFNFSMTAHMIPTLAGLILGGGAWSDEHLHSDSYIEAVQKTISFHELKMTDLTNQMIVTQKQMEDIQDKLTVKIKEYQEKIGHLKAVKEKVPVEVLCQKAEITKRKVALILNDFELAQLQGIAP